MAFIFRLVVTIFSTELLLCQAESSESEMKPAELQISK